MEKESRLWMLRCNTCKNEQSVWDAGGIRFKAVGRPYKLRYCSHCRQPRWLEVYYKGQSA